MVEKELRLDALQLEALARRLDSDPGFIARLYDASEVFREVCGDYTTCQEALEKFRHMGSVDDAKVRDYEEMRNQLESELRSCLGSAARNRKRKENR